MLVEEVFPIKKGMRRTKVQMVLYVLGFIFSSTLLTLFHFTGYLYLSFLIILGLSWLILTLKGFKKVDDKKWARQVFLFSLFVVMGLSLLISVDVIAT